MEAFRRRRRDEASARAVAEILPPSARCRGRCGNWPFVQFFTWLGLFCMWLFYVPAVARHVFGAVDPKSDLFKRGAEWGNFTFSIYAIVASSSRSP